MENHNLTSIQLSGSTKHRLKIACAKRNFTYDEFINELLNKFGEPMLEEANGRIE